MGRWWVPYTRGAMKRYVAHITYTGMHQPQKTKLVPRLVVLATVFPLSLSPHPLELTIP